MMSKFTQIAKQFNHLNLFWRTFLLVATMLAGCLGLWWYTLRTFEIEPRTLQTANQVASLVNLTRSALAHSDPITRLSLIKDLADRKPQHWPPRTL
jgi:two-component system osmolarity sensor histidine kinase EnvZ